jgi:2-phospho-L-lactate transferase/gluconeogenesis factor (CofD/UPF0052 family)
VKIVIVTGGTGSIALQRGLFESIEKKIGGIDVRILVNAYDNGFSTGVVRGVMQNRILGPSDIRKNQVTRLKMMDPQSPWTEFLEYRFYAMPSNVAAVCRERVQLLAGSLETNGQKSDAIDVVHEAIDRFLSAPAALAVRYDDFSIANIIYAGLAAANGNSLRRAASIMAKLLSIPDKVILNDDKSLFLGAVTASGKRIFDEGEIVAWEDWSDPFVDIFFRNDENRDDWPVLCFEAWQSIVMSDLVILSAGTQWSSLIPTYASRGFSDAVRNSGAKFLMVMNRVPDKDSPSQTASDIVNLLSPRFFDAGRLHVLTDMDAHPGMRSLSRSAIAKVASYTQGSMGRADGNIDKHDSFKLASWVGRVFFNEYLDSEYFLFDYDDTLVARQGENSAISEFNRSAISALNRIAKVGICTGNTVRSMSLDYCADASLAVFADGGVTKYSYRTVSEEKSGAWTLEQCICPDTLLPASGSLSSAEIIRDLLRVGIPESMIDNRNNALIAVKPIDTGSRAALLALIRSMLNGSDLEVRESGRTTVEIRKRSLSKIHTLRYLRAAFAPNMAITYIGDECEAGNDRDIYELAGKDETLKCLNVHSTAVTAYFMSTLLDYLNENARR